MAIFNPGNDKFGLKDLDFHPKMEYLPWLEATPKKIKILTMVPRWVLVHPKANQGASFTIRQNKLRLPIQFFGFAPTNNTYIVGLGYWSFVGCFIETSNKSTHFPVLGVCGDLRPQKKIWALTIFLYLGRGQKVVATSSSSSTKQNFGSLTIFYTRMGHVEYALNRRLIARRATR